MTISEVKKDSSSYIEQLMKKFVRNRSCLGLLRFFASHPSGRFSKLAIVHAIDDECNRLEMSQAIEEMVAEKIFEVSKDNGNDFYMLTKEEVLRRLVLNMAVFEWRDWQLVLEHA
ncbi:MAG: hypothetical protein A2Y89_01140 [Chloroflexi bacterium RBG_13_51_18]|nr:MAG: hypothetical protein A2Y89_01140 [Chloroflexi bacterium RBG_13_51_18]